MAGLALITGATSGIGAAAARAFVAAGWRVVVTGRRAERLAELVAELGADKAHALAFDMRDAGAMFDAIVSDIEMPEMDGLQFAQAVRSSGPWIDLPMIALTAHAEPRDVEAGRDAGFPDYVVKFQRDALLSSLVQCLSESVSA